MTLKLNGSSSGYTAIDAPAAAGSNTLVLPTTNGSAGQVLSTDGNGNLSWVTPGLAEVDQWRLTTSFQGDAAPIASNWERCDTLSFGKLGTGMSESSGVFTFPNTGVWRIDFGHFYKNDGPSGGAFGIIKVTLDNGNSWSTGAHMSNALANASGTYHFSNHSMQIIDVTDVSNIKVRFDISVDNNNVTTDGNTSETKTNAMFIKLGET